MSYLVLARKWRPRRFSEVVGQTHVVKTLSNAIKADRVAHSFVFSGVRGVGKTSIARILAQALNCASGPTDSPCGECDSCRTIIAGSAVDVIEIDGASNNSVDDIRDLRETVPYVPQVGRYKIYVIDEVHMLSTSAFNALLKTLEEPPAHVKFMFATTEAHKIPVTILSRCQRYDLRRIPTVAIVDRIRKILGEEGTEADEAALALIGRGAEGSMRDALSILDQVLASSEDRITAEMVADLLGVVDGQVHYDLSRAVLDGDAAKVLDIVRSVDDQGYDIPIFAKGLLEHLRNLVVAGVCRGDRNILDLPDKEAEELSAQASSVSVDTLHRLFKHFAESFEAIARSSHPKILLEASLARIADLGDLVPAADLIKRLEALSSGTNFDRGGAGAGGGGGGGGSSRTDVSRSAPQNRQQEQAPMQVSTALSEEPAPVREEPAPVREEPVKEPVQVQTEERPIEPRSKQVDWTKELERLKRDKPTLPGILECGAPEPREDGKGLIIRFPEEYRAIAGLAKDRSKDIAKMLAQRVGFDVIVEVVVDQAAQVPEVTSKRIKAEEQQRVREEEARNHPLVRRAQSEFGATLRSVQLVPTK